VSKTRFKATRPLAIAALALGMLVARPNLGPTPVVAARVVAGASAVTVESAIPATNPYYDPSQCVYRAWELAAEHGHTLPDFGDAANWRQAAIDDGYKVSDTLTPDAVDSVAVWGPSVGGAGWAGHVGWVTEVKGDQFHVLERNWVGGDSDRWVQWQEGISFITFAKPAPVMQATAPAAAAPSPADDVQALFRGDGVPRDPSLADLEHKSQAERRPNYVHYAGIDDGPSTEDLAGPWA
jgi:surface antigen